jgi:predicted nucleotidyltransferase
MHINDEIKEIAETISKAVPAEKIYLFGSYAYGTPNENSDYDIFIIFPDDSELLAIEIMQEAYWALVQQADAQNKSIHEIDVLAARQSVYDRKRNWRCTIEKEVYTKGVLLYEGVSNRRCAV